MTEVNALLQYHFIKLFWGALKLSMTFEENNILWVVNFILNYSFLEKQDLF